MAANSSSLIKLLTSNGLNEKDFTTLPLYQTSDAWYSTKFTEYIVPETEQKMIIQEGKENG